MQQRTDNWTTREILNRTGLNKQQFADAIGFDRTTVSKVYHGSRGESADFLEAIQSTYPKLWAAVVTPATQKVSVRLPGFWVDEIDEFATILGATRSEVVRLVLFSWLTEL